jgi:hypothetical protein
VENLVSRIPVEGSVFRSTDPTILIDVHAQTIGLLIGEHGYELHELPRTSANAYLVPFYVAQVKNGGHGQYLGNGRRHRGFLDLVDEGLERLGARDFVNCTDASGPSSMPTMPARRRRRRMAALATSRTRCPRSTMRFSSWMRMY